MSYYKHCIATDQVQEVSNVVVAENGMTWRGQSLLYIHAVATSLQITSQHDSAYEKPAGLQFNEKTYP